jgi:hypothetical protein
MNPTSMRNFRTRRPGGGQPGRELPKRAEGQQLCRLRAVHGEDSGAAARRAAAMPWWPRVRNKRPVLSAGVWCWIAAALLALAACSPRPQAVEPIASAPTPWCFAATARFNGGDQAAIGCFQTEALCGNAQRRAVKWGGVAGVREVGTCRHGGAVAP